MVRGAMLGDDRRVDAAAHAEFGAQAHEARRSGGDQVVEDAVGHGFVERAFVAIAPDVQFERFQFDAGSVRHVFEMQVAKSGCPVFGHRQVNSGMRMRMVYSRSGCGFGNVSRFCWGRSTWPVLLSKFRFRVRARTVAQSPRRRQLFRSRDRDSAESPKTISTMRLTTIKLSGFKSFVDPTILHLPTNMTGIVGPNGCGKSNIIDAIRWVMGESAASRLRGEALTDVIFSGSTGRKPVGSAVVELIFDNSDGLVVGEYAKYNEISVKRNASRDGQSQYFLNGARCRRRDITDLFLGTGLGARSYSIIEQGMISEIISAHPDELRGHLEEAAGISKYKERRKETESRIKATRENLERLNDVREEVEKQLEHLNRQAKAAARWQESENRITRGAKPNCAACTTAASPASSTNTAARSSMPRSRSRRTSPSSVRSRRSSKRIARSIRRASEQSQ